MGTDKPVQDFARVGDALIVITRSPGETDWHLEQVDLATGQVLERSAQTFKDALYLRLLYLPEAALLLVSTPETNELVGVNLESLAVTWTAPAIADCHIVLPVRPTGISPAGRKQASRSTGRSDGADRTGNPGTAV